MSLNPTESNEDDKVTHLPQSYNRRATDATAESFSNQSSLADEIDSKQQAFNYDPTQQRENMRGWVTLTIIGIYLLCILLLVGFPIAAIINHAKTLKESIEGFASIGSMLSSHVVPLITLVLGFYFASERK